MEAAGAGAAWIQIKNAIALNALGFMRVAAHHDVKAGRGGIEIQLLCIVPHVNGGGLGFDDLGFRQSVAPWRRIDVASHRENRRKFAEPRKDLLIAHVSGVQD